MSGKHTGVPWRTVNHRHGRVIFKTIKLAFSTSPVLFCLESGLSVLSSGLGVLIVYATTRLFNRAEQLPLPATPARPVVLALGVYFGALAAREVFAWITDHIGFIIGERSIIALDELLHKKAAALDPIVNEDPKYLDCIENAGGGIYSIHYCAANFVHLVIGEIPYLIFMGVYLYTFNPALFFIPLIIFIPVVFSQIARTRSFITLKDEKAPLERKLSQYVAYITDPRYFKETRTLGCFNFFKALYIQTQELLNKKTWNQERRSQTLELISRLICLAGYYGVLALLFFTLVEGAVSAGVFAAVFAAVQRLYETAEHVVVNRAGSILTSEFAEINSTITFLELPERNYGSKEASLEKAITFENVSFTYPGREQEAVKNIDCTIHKGDIVALVGENGSGKTTFAKLLLGIYTPREGAVKIDGEDLRHFSRTGTFKHSSAVFQNFYKYLFTLENNIAISAATPGSVSEHGSSRLDEACQKAGLQWEDAGVFPQGYKTVLSKQFGGVDLSGGEWQKTAIARGLYRFHDLIVLDEPTAAIDPLEESRVYRKFVELAQGKTALIITHRLGSTKIANRIFVMRGGEIIQAGDHPSLMAQEGAYKTLYRSQAKWYDCNVTHEQNV